MVVCLLLLAALIPLGVHFGGSLIARRSFAFRDAAHYYYPLYEWISREWSAGRVPLWNPQENGGFPVLADATSSVFYPGKLLFALPLEFTTNYKLYILLHLVLAGAAAYRLARHWQASQSAGTLAAISYAFGGSVLFQYCNVIYLVGAAWLPVALLAADRMLVGRSWRWSLGLAVVLALMVLGGDPQSAYHAGLLAVLYAGLLWMQRRRHARSRHARRSQATEPTDPDGSTSVHTVRFGRLRPILLGLAAVSALLLSAVQVLPAWQWTRRSERAVFLYPRSIYEIPQYIARPDHESRREGIAKGLFGVPRRGTHHEHTYHFSVGPWRYVSGRISPAACFRRTVAGPTRFRRRAAFGRLRSIWACCRCCWGWERLAFERTTCGFAGCPGACCWQCSAAWGGTEWAGWPRKCGMGFPVLCRIPTVGDRPSEACTG
jgi:hypothetical protein